MCACVRVRVCEKEREIPGACTHERVRVCVQGSFIFFMCACVYVCVYVCV